MDERMERFFRRVIVALAAAAGRRGSGSSTADGRPVAAFVTLEWDGTRRPLQLGLPIPIARALVARASCCWPH